MSFFNSFLNGNMVGQDIAMRQMADDILENGRFVPHDVPSNQSADLINYTDEHFDYQNWNV